MLQDFRFALRLFRKHPAPIAIAIGGLALAIAVVVSVFTIVDVTMLRPFGMDDPQSVVSVGLASERGMSYWRYPVFVSMRDATLSRVEATSLNKVQFGLRAVAESTSARQAAFVSGTYLQTFGGRPSIGRVLDARDDMPGAPLVAVVSDAFWSSELSADPTAIGKEIWLNGMSVTIVGVLRPEFTGPLTLRPSIWMSLSASDVVQGGALLDAGSTEHVEVVARLAPGAPLRAAEEELSGIVSRSIPATSSSPNQPQRWVALFSAASPIDGPDSASSYLGIACIFGIVGLVLAVACANTANLLLAAATTRAHEIGVRLSLGASTGRLVRQMVNESLLLAIIAGACGLLLSMWLAPTLGMVIHLPPEVRLTADTRVLIFTIGIAIVCGVGAGLSPARYGARGHVVDALKTQGGVAPGTARSRLRTSFVGFQAAVSMFLLVAAALFARTAYITTQTDTGFDVERLLNVSFGGSLVGFNEVTYAQSALAAVRAVPAVERVSLTKYLPWGGSRYITGVTVGTRTYQMVVTFADEEFFPTAGVRIVRGRAFTRGEVETHAAVALISENLVRPFFGDSNPIGESISRIPAPDFVERPATIIGVVADAMLGSVHAQVSGAVFRPIEPLSVGNTKKSSVPPGLVIRTARPASAMLAVQNALRRLDPRVQPEVTLLREGLESYLDNKRTVAWLAAPTALLAVLLAVLGVFGVTAFAVSQRMHEVSLRIAIGASAADVQRLLIKDSLWPVIVGVAVGLSLALVAAQYTARMFDIAGISPHDPVSAAGAALVLLTGALAAVIVPARRAARADPASLLRAI